MYVLRNAPAKVENIFFSFLVVQEGDENMKHTQKDVIINMVCGGM